MDKKVAIIIPTKDNINQLRNSIESILRYTRYPNYRIIIIESSSTDGTKEYTDYLAKTDKRIFVYHTKPEGSIKAVNYGISQTTEDEDVYLHQDDINITPLYRRDWLGEMISLSKHPQVGIITTLGGIKLSGKEYMENLQWVGTWSMYIPRKIIKEIGLFDESMKIGEDIDFAYRVQKAGYHIQLIDCWFEHHMTRDKPSLLKEGDIYQDKDKREAEKYFRSKHNLN